MSFEWLFNLHGIVQSIVVFLVALALRLFAVRGCTRGFDETGHLYFAKEVKRQGVGPFGSIMLKVVEAEKLSNPFMWNWLISFLPAVFLAKYYKIVNPCLDAAFTVVLFFLLYSLPLSHELVVIGSLLYLLTPMWFSRLSIGPRVNELTPRLASEIATNLFFIVTLLPIGWEQNAIIAVGAVLAFFVLTTSKFGLQALVLLVPTVSIISQSYFPIISLCFGFILGLVLSKHSFSNALSHHIKHLAWYFQKNLKGEMPVSKRNSFDRDYEYRLDESRFWYLLRVINLLIGRNSYTGVILKLPVLFFVLIGWFYVESNTITDVVMAPVLASSLIFVLINMPSLLFLGEAERYLNHVAVFIVMVAVLIAVQLDSYVYLWGVIAYGMLYLLVEGLVYPLVNKKVAVGQHDADKIVAFLQQQRPTIVLDFPYHACDSVYRIMADTPHKTVFPFGTTAEFSQRLETKYGAKYPYVDLNKLEDMRNDFGANILVTRIAELEKIMGPEWQPPKGWRLIDLGCKSEQVFIYEGAS